MIAAERIDALLPQTQCTRCGYPGCRPYADALSAGTAAVNLCEPGGAALIPQLAELLGVPALAPAQADGPVLLARIREEDCIGCARCLPACPVDAILGARRFGHTVISDECTGCGLCLPPCPVDCIVLESPPADWQAPSAAANRRRYTAHQQRLAQRAAARERRAAPMAPAAQLPELPARDRHAQGASAVQVSVGATSTSSMAERRAALIAAAQAAAAARRSGA